MTPAERAVASSLACGYLGTSALFRSARTIALYAAWRTEADPRALETPAKAVGARIVYPKMLDERIHFFEASHATLKAGYSGILEPGDDAVEVESSAIDLIVVPGLAFSPDGGRLGHGRGHYDRLFAARRSIAVGMAFSCQLLPTLPLEPHDQPLDAVVTDLGLIRVSHHPPSSV